MAKIYDEKEIEDLERQATLKQRQDAAMKILEPEKPDPVAAMREHEAQRRADWHKSNMDARARRLEGMVATEAGRYNPQQQAAALKWLEGNGYGQEGERRRQFDVTNETERIKAREKAAAEREISRNKDGWWDDQGNFHPGATVKAAEAGGNWRLEQQRLKNEGAETVQDKKNEGAATVQDKKNEGFATVQDKKNESSSERNKTLENIANTQANANVEAARERQRKIDERRAQQDAYRYQKDLDAWRALQSKPFERTISAKEAKNMATMSPDEVAFLFEVRTGRFKGDVVKGKDGFDYAVRKDKDGNPVGKIRIKPEE